LVFFVLKKLSRNQLIASFLPFFFHLKFHQGCDSIALNISLELFYIKLLDREMKLTCTNKIVLSHTQVLFSLLGQ